MINRLVMRMSLWPFGGALGLDEGGPPGQTLLGWRYELPAWGWALVCVAAVALAAWSYGGLIGRGWAKVVFATVRAVLVVLIVAVLAGPVLIVRRENIEPDWLLVLVDRSASMKIQDAALIQTGQRRVVSRQAALTAAIGRHADLFGPEQLGRGRRVIWLGFDATTYPIQRPDLDPASLTQPGGQETRLRTAIEQALASASGHPISGVVLLTDGRSPQSTGPQLIRRLSQQAVSVYPVPMGASVQAVDLSLAPVDAPARAFVNDSVPVTVRIEAYPADAPVDPQRVRVRLVEQQSGQVLDEQSLGRRGLSHPVQLTGRSAVSGPVTWRVELDYLPPSAGRDSGASDTGGYELITENNRRQLNVRFIDRPIRVLYVEGYPRWEYRFLKNVLVREKSIESSVMLTSADLEFVQEGDVPIARLPQSPDELRAFDVVIIGDVPSGYFSQQQQSLLRDHVAQGGAGLLWIGGTRHNPYSYESTQLADLLPMRRPGMTQPMAWPGNYTVAPTSLAAALHVLTLDEPGLAGDQAEDPAVSWPPDLPGLRWAQAIGALKPSVEVLAAISMNDEESSAPLVTRLRYGQGQVLYVATDDTWRWRYGRGDLYFQQFWVQLVRMLGRHRVQEDTRPVRLSVSHQRVELQQAVVVELRVSDTMFLQRRFPRIAVAVTRPSDGQDEAIRVLERIDLVPEAQASGLSGGSMPDHRVYKAVWQPHHTGRLVLGVVEAGLKDLGITLPIEVLHPDDELRQPLPDHARLEALANLSGGKVVPPDRLEELATLVPNRSRRTANDIRHPLWDTPWTLVIVMVLLTVEWVGRKLISLV